MKTAFALFAVLLIFTSTLALRTPRGPNQDILQQLYNGFFEQAGLPDPVTVVNCYDDDSAMLTVNFFGTALQYMADLDALSVHRAIKNYKSQAPQALTDCINSNAEMQTAQKAYNLPNWNLDQLATRIEYYALDHVNPGRWESTTIVNVFKSFANQANNDYQSGDYHTVGQEGGAFIAQIFKKTGLKSDRDTLQQVFNGFWEQGGLADPQTAVGCFDDNSATQAVNPLRTE